MPIEIQVEQGAERVLPVTLDLVSPDMPMHGILRYAAESRGAGTYFAQIDVPMEGYWELYVNLDYGADAAVFELNVASGPAGERHQHGPVSTPVDYGDHDNDTADHHRRGSGS